MFIDGSAIASGHCNVISGTLLICDGKWKHHICGQWEICCRQVDHIDVDQHDSLDPDLRFWTSALGIFEKQIWLYRACCRKTVIMTLHRSLCQPFRSAQEVPASSSRASW
jgi:hypothetical protein